MGHGKCNAMGTMTGSVFEYNGTWSEVAPVSNAPGNRLAFDSLRNRIVTFGGGYPSLTGPRETWQYDGTNWQMVTTSHAPQARTDPLIAYDSTAKRTVIFGGKNLFNVDLTDMWEYRY